MAVRKIIPLRFSAEEEDAIRSIAAETGATFSDAARSLIAAGLNQRADDFYKNAQAADQKNKRLAADVGIQTLFLLQAMAKASGLDVVDICSKAKARLDERWEQES